MKIRDVLDYVIELQEPAFSETVLLRWLNQVEAEIQTEVLLLAVDGIVQYSAEDLKAESNTELIVPAPFSKLYEDYLLWRIALGQGEAERANNLETIYHNSYLAYVRFVCDTIAPGSGKADQLRYYLTAYQIAVKYGYAGSEKEWVNSLKGDDGKPGAGLKILAQVAAEAQLPAEGMEIGDGYLVGEGTEALLYIWDGKEWFYKTKLSGKGEKGDPGDRGEQGVGVQSVRYKEKTEAGNVYTIILTNGNQYDFTAPAGPAGPIGPVGPTGSGVDVEYDGTTGTVKFVNGEGGGEGGAGADGVGIYNIAFKEAAEDGYVYTITLTDGSAYDFTAPKGPAGNDGNDGADGKDGKDGRGIASVEYDAARDVLTVDYDDGTRKEVAGFGTWMKADTYDPDGTVAAAGGIQKFVEENVPEIPSLSSSVSSESTTTAATSYAVKQAYDKAAEAIPATEKNTKNGVAGLDSEGLLGEAIACDISNLSVNFGSIVYDQGSTARSGVWVRVSPVGYSFLCRLIIDLGSGSAAGIEVRVSGLDFSRISSCDEELRIYGGLYQKDTASYVPQVFLVRFYVHSGGFVVYIRKEDKTFFTEGSGYRLALNFNNVVPRVTS